MNCPKCRNEELTPFNLGDLELDRCAGCEGVWFDKGEVGPYLRFSKDLPDLKRSLATAETRDVACPRCNTHMQEMPYVPEARLLIDRCPSCEGVWLDGGELPMLARVPDGVDSTKVRLARAIWEMRQQAGLTTPLSCPKCEKGGSMYAMNTSEKVTVDFCGGCGGVWFEKGEAGRMVELSSDIPDFDKVVDQARDTDMACPTCRRKLVVMPYSPLGDLEIEYCKSCGGIFLDKHEMGKLEHLATLLESPGERLGRAIAELHREGYTTL